MSVDIDDYTPIKKYRSRLLTVAQNKFCEAYLAGESPHNSAVIAGYKNPSRASGYLLKAARIKAHLNKMQPRIIEVPITFESKAKALNELMNKAIVEQVKEEKPNVQLIDRGLEAIDMLNRMQGHYAPEQSQSVQVTVKATQDKLIEAKKAYDEY